MNAPGRSFRRLIGQVFEDQTAHTNTLAKLDELHDIAEVAGLQTALTRMQVKRAQTAK